MASGRLIIPLAEPALNAAGQVAPGTLMTVYETGTTTLATICSDSGLTTPILNPQTANAAGRFEEQATVFWLDAGGAYDVLLHFPDGSSITFDQIYVLGAQTNVSGFAPINSPAFTGVPTAPTPSVTDNSQKLATTAYVQDQDYAPLASPAFTGNPTAPTPAAGNSSISIATTAYVEAAISGSTSVFTSSEYSVVSGTAVTNIAHGLKTIPHRVQAFLRCKASNNGYTVGCEVPINIDANYESGGARSCGAVGFAVSATNIGYIIAINGVSLLAVSPAGDLLALGSEPTSPDWMLFLRAWAN
jgi:hypothetical protein